MRMRVMLAGGGTGGHLFPGIAVVQELRRRASVIDVVFVGTAKGLEARLLPTLGESLALIDVRPLKGRGLGERWRSLCALPTALWQARALVAQHRPDVVLGLGGYAAGPLLLAAAAMGIPTALLEQNVVPGLTNRLALPWVGRAYFSFACPGLKPRVARKVRVCGNPIRRDFVHAVRRLAADPDGVEARARIISVIGGSQGARALNEAVPALLAQVGVAHSRLEVWHQSGAAMQAEVEARYRRLGIRARVLPFIDDMASLYARSRLVVARAGAGTVAELCAVGRPSLLVPYPHAADDHQRRNAERLAAAGAALWAPESELSSPALAAQLRAALVDPAERTRMATAARNLGAPDAAATLVDDLLAWMGGEAPSVAPDGPASGTQPPGVATLSAYLPRRRSAGRTTPMALDRRPLLSFSGALH